MQMTKTELIEARAAQFLLRRTEPDWSGADQGQLDQWLAESIAHKAAYWRLEHGYSQVDRLTALNIAPHREMRGKTWKLALAASLAFVAVNISWWQIGNHPLVAHDAPAPTIYATAFGSIGTANLADGSLVSLNSDTKIRFSQSSGQRTVWLDKGEAYFEVAHNRLRPFVIHTGIHDVRVLGTKFSIDRTNSGLKVSVLQGSVRVDDGAPKKTFGSVILFPGQTAVGRGREFLVKGDGVSALENALGWRTGMLILDNATVGEAAARFNRYHRRKLVVTDPDIAAMRIGGSFRLSNLEGFANLLEAAYGLNTKRSDTQIIISH